MKKIKKIKKQKKNKDISYYGMSIAVEIGNSLENFIDFLEIKKTVVIFYHGEAFVINLERQK